MKRLALASLAVLLSVPVIASSAIAFTERLDEGVNKVRPTFSALGDGASTQPAAAQTLPENIDCIKEGDTTALNDRFDEARRQNLDLALNDRFEDARRQNLDLALNDRFDEARRQNLDLALNDRFEDARRQNLDLALNDRFDEARRQNLNS
jgi:hypothetical protein